MKKIVSIMLCLLLLFALCGCEEADRVRYNVSKEADNRLCAMCGAFIRNMTPPKEE